MRALARLVACLATASMLALPGSAGTRLKDIIDVEGVRDNQLIGYGVVFGLNGTGDSVRNCPPLRQSIESMMERLGINTRDSVLNTKNAAAVMVTANLPPFATNGTRIDVSVSAICDAKSLEGARFWRRRCWARMDRPMLRLRVQSRLARSRPAAIPVHR